MYDNEQDELGSIYQSQPGLMANPNAPPKQSLRDKILMALAAQYRPQDVQPQPGIMTPEQQKAQQTQQAMANIGKLMRGLL